MSKRATPLPNFLLEDYLGLLRGFVGLAWGGVAAMALVKAWMQGASDLPWPRLGGFDTTYNLILAEFTLNTAMLTLLVFIKDWYERVPRTAADRVRWLLIVVTVWAGLHYFAAFHVSGSLRGPLLPLLPVLILAAFLGLPGRGAWAAAAFLLAGHAAVLLLERHALIHPRGLLTDAFALDGPGLFAALAFFTVLIAVTLGALARYRLDEAGAALHRGSRVNPLTGLYEHEFFMQRLTAELGRLRRQGGSLSVLLMEFDGLTDFTAHQGYDAGRELLRRAAHALIKSVRQQMDTPARYAPKTFALLMPMAGTDYARTVAERVRELVEEQIAPGTASLKLRAGLVNVRRHEGMDAGRVITAASEALRKARETGQPLVELEAAAMS